jgi:hypothetical protein
MKTGHLPMYKDALDGWVPASMVIPWVLMPLIPSVPKDKRVRWQALWNHRSLLVGWIKQYRCLKRRNRTGHHVPCLQCGTPVYVTASTPRKFCGRVCAVKWRMDRRFDEAFGISR